MSAALPDLPPQARQEVCAQLIELGLYAQVRDLLPPDDAFGARAGLLAGDLATTRRFVRSSPDPFLHGCLDLASGDPDALERTERLLAEDPSVLDSALFALVAAPYDLHRAGVAARPALGVVPAVLPVVAADRAADADFWSALALLEGEPWNGLGEDPVHRTLTLLREHQRPDAALTLIAHGVHSRDLPLERSRYWSRLGEQLVGRSRLLAVLQGVWLVAGIALSIWLGPVVFLSWLAISYCARRFVPLAGLDLETSHLLREHRAPGWRATELVFADVVAFLGGGLIGMVFFAFLGRNGSDAVLSGFLLAGLAVGALSGAVGRRFLSRRLVERGIENERRRAASDLRCRCLTLDHLIGVESASYVELHLRPVDAGLHRIPRPASWRLLQCPQTGNYFLNWPAVVATVRVRGMREPGRKRRVHPLPVIGRRFGKFLRNRFPQGR